MQTQIWNYLSQTALFSGLSEQQLGSVAELASIKRFQKGEMVFAEGSEAREFLLVVGGKVKIVKYSNQGKEQVLHIFGSYQPVGEVAVFLNNPFPANCIAMSNVEVLLIRRSDFVKLIEHQPELGLRLLAVLAQRLHDFSRLVFSLSLAEAPTRLARFLLEMLAESATENGVLQLPFSKLELAKTLGMTPETLSRTFNRLKKEGLVTVEKRQVKVLNRQGLTALAALD